MDIDINTNQTNNEFLFQEAITQAFKRISESVKVEEFQRILVILNSRNTTSRKLSEIFTNELNKSMNAILDEICSEGSLTKGLVKLNSLTEEITTVTNSNIWRPPGEVKIHLRSHDSKTILDECDMLTKQISEIETKNEEKVREIAESRQKIYLVQEQITQLLNRSKFSLSYVDKMIDTLEEYISGINVFEDSEA